MFRRTIFSILFLFCLNITAQASEVGNAIEQFGDSVVGGLENLGQTLNNANSSILGENPAPNNPQLTYDEQLRAYRQAENARVQELATVSGVSPDVIRELRANGMTWEQIANKYNINLQNLPLPPNVPPQINFK